MPVDLNRRNLLRLAGGLGAGAALSPLVTACGAGTSGSDSDDNLTLGFMTALTGLETILGKTQYQCFELAVKQVNAGGGIDGRTVRVVREDDASDSKQTIDKANKLALQDRATAVVGLITSLEREAALTVLPKNRVPLLYTTYYEGAFGGANACDPYYFGLGQIPNQQIDPLVPYLSEQVGKTYYIIGSDYSWPRGTSARLKELAGEAGGSVVGEQYTPFGTTDFSKVFRDLASAKPDICWVTLAGSDFVTFLTQYAQFEAKPRLVSIGMDDVFAHENPEVAKGVVTSQAYLMGLSNPANKKFLNDYQSAYGKNAPVNSIGIGAYNAVNLIKGAIEAAESTETDKWLPELSKVSFDGPGGEVRIDPTNQHSVSATYIGEVIAGGTISILDETDAVGPEVAGCSL